MPNEPIKINTIDGQKLTLYDYSLIGDSAIASVTDTIALRDITSIKGKVKGNAFRKISGVVLFGAGASLAVMYTFVGIAFSIPEAYLLSVPAIGVAYTGRALAEARRFETTRKWSLSISPKSE